MKSDQYLLDWPKCEIESVGLTSLQKKVAWAIQEVAKSECNSECWPGNCYCAFKAAEKAKEF